jgi:beta-lactam-binding protein with PASTA domain
LSIASKILSVLGRLGVVIAIAIAFILGMATTVYLSLHSPEVRVPEVVGKDRFVAESELSAAGLNFRVRKARPSNQVKADTVLFQVPHAGEMVKAGQTVAVDVSRGAKEGEASETVAPEQTASPGKANENRNANESSSGNLNENRPKKNKNANANTNSTANGNTNARSANANRPNANVKANANVNPNKVNTNAAGAGTGNTNRGDQTGNTNSSRPNRNANRTPPTVAPTPPQRR